MESWLFKLCLAMAGSNDVLGHHYRSVFLESWPFMLHLPAAGSSAGCCARAGTGGWAGNSSDRAKGSGVVVGNCESVQAAVV